ncbi:hypothetical protein BaRGS_00029281 [Batillaria attramentaria]|uniref:DUF4706 domain-containing protein n=1 Tax=Batillaria attramentaria TaxID=370345 RepID=A0ABD0JWI7_9CAEN
MDELKALSYFSSLSHISRQIAAQEKSLIKYLGNKWDEYTPEQQEELLDDLCVPDYIREVQPPCADDESDGVPPCWPTLKLPSGEKIIVDENDIWTWRDEHSGPFSWKSKSQQDLTLLDFEPENLAKPLTKGRKSESEEHEQPPVNPCQRPFLSSANTWTQVVLTEYAERTTEPVTPVQTPTHAASPVESPCEEVNPAFEGSCENLSPTASPSHTTTPATDAEIQEEKSSAQGQGDIELEADVHAPKGKSSKGRKSPSPKKILRSGSFKKEGKGKTSEDTGHQLLIAEVQEEGRNAFSNPALESEAEWSNFVGQTTTDASVPSSRVATGHTRAPSSDSRSNKSAEDWQPPVSEPVAMVMDRGGGRGGNESVESTPDHMTQLLKPSEAVVKAMETEEVLYVVKDGAGISVSTDKAVTGSTSSLDIPKTGFDFLDDW